MSKDSTKEQATKENKMKKLVTAIVGIIVGATLYAEPLPYFEMKQFITNSNPMDAGVGISVTGILLTNGMVQASNLVAELEADPDYFAGDIAYDANIHMHDHYNPSPCWLDFVASHRSKKDPLTKYMVLSEDIDNPNRYIPETWVLAVVDKQDANRKQKKIEDRNKSKKWKVRQDHGI